MRRPLALTAAFGLLLSLTGLPTPAAAVSFYHGKNPYSLVNGVVCANSAQIVASELIDRSVDDVYYGRIKTYRSTQCATVWAQAEFSGDMPYGAWGIAWVTTLYGARNCDSPGGNGRVLPGQWTCRTPMVDFADSPNDVKSQGHEYRESSPDKWYIYATGTSYWPDPF